MRLAFASLLLLLAACGQPVPRDVVTVRTYTDANGRIVPPTGNLGFTYGPVGEGGSKYGEAGFNVLLNRVLADGEPDDDRLVRVILHELGNVIVLDTGAFPPEMDGSWFLWDGDGKAPFTEIGPDEAAWFAAHGPYRVNVADDWLRQPVAEAILRIALASGREVFK